MSELKETKEVVKAIATVGVKVVGVYKQAKADGKLDLNDAALLLPLLLDPDLKSAIEAAIAGSDKIGEEISTAKVVDVLKAALELQPDVDKLLDEVKSL